MRLPPYQIAFLFFSVFWAGVLFALLLLHGQTQPPPEYPPFQAPF
jgi:hypothetical protein